MVASAMSEDASEIARLRAELAATKAELAQAQAVVSASEAMISHLKLEIAKLRREQYGQQLRTPRPADRAAGAAARGTRGRGHGRCASGRGGRRRRHRSRAFERRRPARKPFPEHLPRERVVVEAPTTCSCCGSSRIVKMGEDITETLEVIPRQWKVIQTVREKFTCRDCEKISQPPAPFHAIPRGWAGPSLIAMVAFEKFGQHQPLNRPGRALRARGRRSQPVHPGRPRRPCHRRAGAAPCPDRAACAGGRPPARRRHDRAAAGPGRHADRAALDLCPRRSPLRRRRAARRAVLLLDATGRRPIPTGISPGGRASCRPTPMAATTTSTGPIALRGR